MSSITNKNIVAKPFLRWTGSKSWLVKDGLDKFIPKTFKNYHEPFLGGGSVFFSFEDNRAAYLYDLNEELINTYQQIKDNVDLVINSLKRLKNSEDEYYRIRSAKTTTPHTSAARFIYLNRTSFNGIYRVNSKGLYNVPYGRRKNVDIITDSNLKAVSSRLKNVELMFSDFEEVLTKSKRGDLVFLDPPYTVAHENNGFIAYNQKLFSWSDQERLAMVVKKLSDMGCYFILTNASHPSIVQTYSGLGEIYKVSRHSKVGGRNKTRGDFNELIITNII